MSSQSHLHPPATPLPLADGPQLSIPPSACFYLYPHLTSSPHTHARSIQHLSTVISNILPTGPANSHYPDLSCLSVATCNCLPHSLFPLSPWRPKGGRAGKSLPATTLPRDLLLARASLRSKTNLLHHSHPNLNLKPLERPSLLPPIWTPMQGMRVDRTCYVLYHSPTVPQGSHRCEG